MQSVGVQVKPSRNNARIQATSMRKERGMYEFIFKAHLFYLISFSLCDYNCAHCYVKHKSQMWIFEANIIVTRIR